MNFLRKYIFANAGLKILALAISFLLWATYTPSFRRGANIEWDMKFDKDRSSLEPFRGVRPKSGIPRTT